MGVETSLSPYDQQLGLDVPLKTGEDGDDGEEPEEDREKAAGEGRAGGRAGPLEGGSRTPHGSTRSTRRTRRADVTALDGRDILSRINCG